VSRYNDMGLFIQSSSAMATVRACKWCKHAEVVRSGQLGVGRGYGMREGNKARGRMIQHVKAAHPAEYASAMKGEVA
jgi:hypothetical protein